MPPHRIAQLGIGYCPEERGIFASLSCEENLMLPPPLVKGGMSVDDIYQLFPNLRERRTSPARACRARAADARGGAAYCGPAPRCCCSMKSPKGWRR